MSQRTMSQRMTIPIAEQANLGRQPFSRACERGKALS